MPAFLYCAYCGKPFSRKEHLERHLPTHTNVKPHRCSACQLSFARRDLLQRHHSTYHEARDPMEPLPGGVPTVAGKTPIACLNCAQAKTGCDKHVPCARCAEKNLECSARYARRSSKAALRAAQAGAAMKACRQTALPILPTTTTPTGKPNSPTSTDDEGKQSSQTINPALMDVDHQKPETARGTNTPAHGTPAIDPVLQKHRVTSSDDSPNVSHLSSRAMSPNDIQFQNAEDFMQFESDFMPHDSHYQDLLLWQDIPMDFSMYPGESHMVRNDMYLPAVPDLGDLGCSSSSSDKMNSSHGSMSTHTRSTSIASSRDMEAFTKAMSMPPGVIADGSLPESEAVIIAEAGWPLARCNPPIYSSTCPRTGILHLECLEQKSKQEGAWNALEQDIDRTQWDDTGQASIIPMTSSTRDRMMAITQTFLHKALDIHRGGVNTPSSYKSCFNSGQVTFLVLPPSNILVYFLRCYVMALSFFYSLVSAGSVNPNDLLSSNQASALLVLLMIAQGAAMIPSAEARALSVGLIETCRISLFDMIEKNVEMSADPTTLQCALLFTILGAWSGDKWLMDIAMGQRGMYLSMLKHAGMFEVQLSMVPALSNLAMNVESEWRSWLRRETQNRLAYNWVMVDQELSLFHDTAPLLSVNELLSPLPGPELLWTCANADQWYAALQSIYGRAVSMNPSILTSQVISPSLYDLFQDFLHNDTLPARSTTPQQLRLLLHPLQCFLCHARLMSFCVSDILSTNGASSRIVTKETTQSRVEEVQALLQKWYGLTVEYQKTNPSCTFTKTNLILYHLISLNAITSFPEVERLARCDAFDGSHWNLSLRHKRCISQRLEAIFHCGQVLRLLCNLPPEKRPSWWAAALYRAVLILWADSISRLDPTFQPQPRPKRRELSKQDPLAPDTRVTTGSDCGDNGDQGERPGAASSGPFAIDQLTTEDSTIYNYLWLGTGVPVLTGLNGAVYSLDKPDDILGYAIHTIQGTGQERPSPSLSSSRFSDGIRRKLIILGTNWQGFVINSGNLSRQNFMGTSGGGGGGVSGGSGNANDVAGPSSGPGSSVVVPVHHHHHSHHPPMSFPSFQLADNKTSRVVRPVVAPQPKLAAANIVSHAGNENSC